MADIVEALRELTASNKQLVTKLDEIKEVIVGDIEERKRREEHRRRNHLEMDIQFVMTYKNCDRETALEKLQKHEFDVCRVIKGRLESACSKYDERIMAHYEHKKNREIIEMW